MMMSCVRRRKGNGSLSTAIYRIKRMAKDERIKIVNGPSARCCGAI